MSDEEKVQEARGESVEAAVASALEVLRAGRDDVEVEVVDEGSSGFLGFGGRDAVVRVRLKSAPRPAEAKAGPATAETDRTAGELGEQEVALDIVKTLLAKMGVEATATAGLSDADELTGEQVPVIEVRGKDLGILIGPRGETLNAFQYVTRLITGHTIRSRPSVIVDVEGYRRRREQALERLAQRMAGKVTASGHPMTLEPMPPNERRIVHMTLRSHARVRTESTGEGERRRVRIIPK